MSSISAAARMDRNSISRWALPSRRGLISGFQCNEFAACQGEPARPGLFPHRGQQTVIRLNAFYAVDDHIGIDVDRLRQRAVSAAP